MPNPLTAASLKLSNFTQKGIYKKNVKSGVISKLAPEMQIMFGQTDMFTFMDTPKAELVGEGADKASMDADFQKVVAKTYKVQTTYRFTDELMKADKERQLGVIDALTGNLLISINRSLDLLAIHGVNPATGIVSEGVLNYFAKSSNGVAHIAATADPAADIEKGADSLVANGSIATGIAFDPVYAAQLARLKDKNGRQMYPEMGLGWNVEGFQGVPAASANTISGAKEIASAIGGKRIQALMGDFDAFRWGVNDLVKLDLIEYGNPDGKGDLKQQNQIAIRAEAYIGFVILDGKAFALIEKDEA